MIPCDSDRRSLTLAAILWLLIAFGVLAFGAVYPWAYQPLLAAAGLVGAYGLVTSDTQDRRRLRVLAATLCAAVALTLLQLVPMQSAVLARVSPGTHAFLQRYEIGYGLVSGMQYPVSIAPSFTWRGLGMLVVLTVFLTGATMLVPRMRLGLLVRGIIGLGLAVAVFGIVQRATFNRQIYWVWTPQYDPANAFGPFVNRNHFAGWMLMVASLTLGYMYALVARIGEGTPGTMRDWRRRFTSLASPDASRLAFAGFAFAVMALSIVWTLSRSGIAALTVVVVLMGLQVIGRFSGARRAVGLAVLPAALVFAWAWKGMDVVAGWYGNTTTLAWRIQLWRDTLPIVRDFWLFGTGLNTYGVSTLAYPMTDETLHAVQAHNDYVQIVAEGGVLLAAVVLAAIAALAGRIWQAFGEPQGRSVYWIRMGATAGLVGIAVQELSDFSLQMPGNAVLFAVLAAVAMHRATPHRRDRSSRAGGGRLSPGFDARRPR